ncbi:MAG: hypothetical protein AAFX06_07680 [Planctomycetota bacterium]
MRPTLAAILSLALVVFVGCGKPQPTNIAEGLEQSDVEKYNQMLQEEQATMADGEAAAKAAGVKDY